MSASARIFAYFVDWCARHALNAGEYRITITPLTSEAEVHLKAAWKTDWDHLRFSGPSYRGAPRDPDFYEGHIMAVPFKIESFK